jgi:hypothetical protein
MATNKYQVVEVLSDVSGEKGASTITYSINGQSYSIDLTEPETKEFHEMLAPYISVSSIGKRRGPRLRSTPEETAKIREWAQATGHTLTPAGRVPAETRLAYAEALAAGTVETSAPKKASRSTRTRKAKAAA